MEAVYDGPNRDGIYSTSPNVSPESEINNALIKENVTDRVIASLKAQYEGLKLKSIDDKEGYLEIKEARNNVRKIGILAEKVCKKGREEALRTQKLWIAKEKEVLGKI